MSLTPYELRYLATHLREAGPHRYDDLYALISRRWLDAKLEADATVESFADDVNVALDVARHQGAKGLPAYVGLSIVIASLRQFASRFDASILGAVATVLGLDLAAGFAELLSRQSETCDVLVALSGRAAAAGDAARAASLLMRAESSAAAIEDEAERLITQIEIAGAWAAVDRERGLALLGELEARFSAASFPEDPQRVMHATILEERTRLGAAVANTEETALALLRKGRVWDSLAVRLTRAAYRSGGIPSARRLMDAMQTDMRLWSALALAEMDVNRETLLQEVERDLPSVRSHEQDDIAFARAAEISRTDVRRALRLARKVHQESKNRGSSRQWDHSWSVVISRLARRNRAAAARVLKTIGKDKSITFRVRTEVLIAAERYAQEPAESRSAVRRAIVDVLRTADRVRKWTALEHIAEWLAHFGAYDDALDVARTIEYDLDKRMAYEHVIGAMIRNGHAADALPLLPEIAALPGSPIHGEVDQMRVSILMANGRRAEAEEIAAANDKPVERAGLALRISVFDAAMNGGEAADLDRRLAAYAAARSASSPDDDLTIEIMKIVHDLPRRRTAVEERLLARSIAALKPWPDNQRHLWFLERHITELCARGEVDDALATLKHFPANDDGVQARERVLVPVLAALAREGRHDEGAKLLEDMHVASYAAAAHAAIAAATVSDSPELAAHMARKALAIVEVFPKWYYSSLASIAAGLWPVDPAAAEKLFERAIADADAEEDDGMGGSDDVRNFTRRAVLKAVAEVGGDAVLREIHVTLDRNAQRGRDHFYRALSLLIETLARFGGVQLLRDLVAEIRRVDAMWRAVAE